MGYLPCQKIIIPQACENEALVAARIHLFVDGHFGTKSKRWLCWLNLLDVVRYSSFHDYESLMRNAHIGNRYLKTERWREWEREELPSLPEILSGAKTLLQRYKRTRGLRGLNQWLKRTTPKNWNIPLDMLPAGAAIGTRYLPDEQETERLLKELAEKY